MDSEQKTPGSIEISVYKPPLAPEALLAPEESVVSGGAAPDFVRDSSPFPPRVSAAPRAPLPRPSTVSVKPKGWPDRRSPRPGRYSSAKPDFPRRLAVGATAAFLSLTFHALIVTSMLWSSGSKDTRRHDAGTLDTVAPETADDGALKVVLIQDASDAPAAAFVGAGAPLSTAPAVVPLPSLDALADAMSVPEFSVDPASTVSTPAPDAALRSAMYGRYVGQIDARIERAWLRPRTGIGAPFFTCLVRVDQDSRGTVEEVTLEHCNGSERWQQSLVNAIESASPLPAPPDPVVFTRILHLSFQSKGYSPDAPQDAYEPVLTAQRLAETSSPEQQNDRALAAFGRALREPGSHQVIPLTLTGDPAAGSAPAGLTAPVDSPPAASKPPPTRPPAE